VVVRLPLASAVCVHGSALSACLQFPWSKNDIMICHYEPAVVSTSLNVDTVKTFLDLLYSAPVAAVESTYFSAVLQSNPGFHWDLSLEDQFCLLWALDMSFRHHRPSLALDGYRVDLPVDGISDTNLRALTSCLSAIKFEIYQIDWQEFTGLCDDLTADELSCLDGIFSSRSLQHLVHALIDRGMGIIAASKYYPLGNSSGSCPK